MITDAHFSIVWEEARKKKKTKTSPAGDGGSTIAQPPQVRSAPATPAQRDTDSKSPTNGAASHGSPEKRKKRRRKARSNSRGLQLGVIPPSSPQRQEVHLDLPQPEEKHGGEFAQRSRWWSGPPNSL